MNRLYSILFPVLILFFVLFSLYPTYYELTKRDTIRPERQFELVHNFYTDFNFYLSRIRQGLEGNLTVQEKYTSEAHEGSFIHIFYLALGWIGKWVMVPWDRTGDIYHMARIVLSVVLLSVIAEICRRTLEKVQGLQSAAGRNIWVVIAFLLAVTASTYPKLVHMNDGTIRYGGYMPWWSVMDSLQRITFLPHLLAGQAMFAFMLLALSSKETLSRPHNWFFLGIFGFFLGMIFPPGLLFVACAMPFIIGFHAWNEWKSGRKSAYWIRWLVRFLVPYVVTGALAVPSLIYLQLMTTFYPWKELALQDVLRPLPFEYLEYFQGMGLVFPVGFLGLLWALKKRDISMVLPVSWVATWMALLVIFKNIPQQSPLRFSEMIPHVPLGILSAYLFYSIAKSRWYEKKIGNPNEFQMKSKKQNPNGVNLKTVLPLAIFIIPAVWIGSNLFHMHSSWLWQKDFVHHKVSAEIPLVPTGSYVMYPLREFLDAIRFIQDNTSRDTVVLAEWNSSNYIPVYSGNTVYVGHDNTVNSEEKKLFVRSFYNGAMDAPTALKWLKEEGIKVVFFGPLELEDAAGRQVTEFYPFLREVFANTYVKIYFVD